MAKFAYNNAKNASTGYMSFDFNCGYHLQMLYKDNINACSKSKFVDNLLAKLKQLIIVCQKNLNYAQKLQKHAHNKGVKPRNYAFENKIWLYSKYIKIKQNWKLKTKFSKAFWVLYLIKKQAYKLELSKR